MFRTLKRLMIAISYVTCITLARIESEEELHGLAKYLPTAGLLIGMLLAMSLLALLAAHVNSILIAGLLTIGWLILTNGLHYDGLMDTADGIFSHQSRERMLEIMHDPRVGNFGVLAGVAVMLLKFSSLASIHLPSLLITVLLVPAWGRWCETFAISRFPYARDTGKGKVWHDTTVSGDLVKAAVIPLTITLLFAAIGYPSALICSFGTITSGVTSAYWLNNKLGGQTGDTYGCVVETAEAGGMVISAIVLSMLAKIAC